MDSLKHLHELALMSQRLNMPFLQHFFKTFDPDVDTNLASTISHFHLRENNLETTDYRSAYHQLCDWFYGWNVTDGTAGFTTDTEATEHFRMKRVPREIVMKEKGERLECERIMKTYETLFIISRRALKKIYLEIEEEIPRIGTGLGTMQTQGRDEDNDASGGIDKEDLWKFDPNNAQLPRDEDYEDELEEEDDLAHFTSSERRVSRVAADGMIVRRKSVMVAAGNPLKEEASRNKLPVAEEGDESGNDFPVKSSDQLKSPKSSRSQSPQEDDGKRISAARKSVGEIEQRRASVAQPVITDPASQDLHRQASNSPWLNLPTVFSARVEDADEALRLTQRDINHIYSQSDRSVDFTLVCISNILLILGVSELLDDKPNFEKFYAYAHDISAEFVSNTLKTVWDLLNRELPNKMNLENLRNPDLLKQRFKDAPRNKIKKLYRKFILIHELLRALDIHIFPNFVAAHKEGIKCTQFSIFDSSLWLTGGYDCIIRIHDIRPQYVGHKSIITDVHFAKDDTMIVSSSFDRTIKIWNAQSSSCEKTLTGHTDSVTSCDVTIDGRYIASASTDCTVRLWDFATGECVCVIKRHTRWVKRVRFSHDGRYLISAGLDCKIYTWDVKFLMVAKAVSHTRCIETHSDYILDIATLKPTFVLSTSRDCTVRMHEFLTGQELVCVDLSPSWACTVAFSRDGTYFVTGSFDNNINIYTTADGEKIREIRALNLGIMSVGFPRDLEYVVVGTVEGFLQQIFL
ncbi:WD40-repeat-containing domain protein [Chytridium lagenaria]|nr:WD40-repeat-containing domain protein [Chytridium lagenaria]